MLRSYLIAAMRNLIRHKTYTAINLLGLGIGIACCYLCVLYVVHEWSFDKFHRDYDRIYLMVHHAKYAETEAMGALAGTREERISFPAAMAHYAKSEIAEIEIIARIGGTSIRFPNWYIGVEKEDPHVTDEVLCVDESFYDLFSFPMLYGCSPSEGDGIVLTEAFAKTISTDAGSLIGKILSVRSQRYRDRSILLPVSGIIASPPGNSSLQFKVLLSFRVTTPLLDNQDGAWAWINSGGSHFVRLSSGASREDVERKLTDILRQHPYQIYDSNASSVKLRSLSELHYNSHNNQYRIHGLLPSSNPLYSYLLAGISVLILAVACLNYALLYAGRFSSRTKEFGLRQILGASRRHLGYQILLECLCASILSGVVALSFAEWMVPVLEGLLQTEFAGSADPLVMGLILLSIACLTGLSTTLYPAVLMSSLSPLGILRKEARVGRPGPFLRVLMAVQSGVTLVLIFCALVLFRQVHFLTASDLGFKETNLIGVRIERLQPGRAEAFQQALKDFPGIVAIAKTRQPIGFQASESLQDGDGHVIENVNYHQVDRAFVETVGLEVVSGKGFEDDSPGQVLINASLLKRLNLSDPLGQSLFPVKKGSRMFGSAPDGRIVGVVKDFHFHSLHHVVPPTVITLAEPGRGSGIADRFWQLLIRIQSGREDAFLTHLNAAWKNLNVGSDLSYKFIEDDLRHAYAKEARWRTIVSWASFCAIFISAIGALGMVCLTVARKEKEIALRKIMGALPAQIAGGIVFSFVVPGLVAAAVALPIAYFAIEHYLAIFPYRVHIGAGTAVGAIIFGVLLPVAGGFAYAFRAASRSPIIALRED